MKSNSLRATKSMASEACSGRVGEDGHVRADETDHHLRVDLFRGLANFTSEANDGVLVWMTSNS